MPGIGEAHSKECDTFVPYTSNPQLCKACSKPVTEHKSFMARWNAERQKLLAAEEYDKKRERLIELAGTDIDPEPEDIDLGGGIKIPRKEFDELRKWAITMQNTGSTVTATLMYPLSTSTYST